MVVMVNSLVPRSRVSHWPLATLTRVIKSRVPLGSIGQWFVRSFFSSLTIRGQLSHFEHDLWGRTKRAAGRAAKWRGCTVSSLPTDGRQLSHALDDRDLNARRRVPTHNCHRPHISPSSSSLSSCWCYRLVLSLTHTQFFIIPPLVMSM